MNKLMTVVAASVCAVSLSVPAFAEEKSTEKPSAGEAEAEVAEEEESALPSLPLS